MLRLKRLFIVQEYKFENVQIRKCANVTWLVFCFLFFGSWFLFPGPCFLFLTPASKPYREMLFHFKLVAKKNQANKKQVDS